MATVQERADVKKTIAWVAFLLWAIVLAGGAVGEIFHVDGLRETFDLKRLFLR
jgi:hypothetical protein